LVVLTCAYPPLWNTVLEETYIDIIDIYRTSIFFLCQYPQALYNQFGGPKIYLENELGAVYVQHCYTDNCNVRDDRGFN
jgi:hypothetical protein